MAEQSERWDRHFLSLALAHARLSKDPSTKIGAVIVGPDREIISFGFNGFPRGIADTEDRLNDRETKLKLIVHAEVNACMACARIGTSSKGCTMYLAAIDKDGSVWGGAPCIRCAVEVIQAGIAEIVSYPIASAPERWRENLAESRDLLNEAGVVYRQISL